MTEPSVDKDNSISKKKIVKFFLGFLIFLSLTAILAGEFILYGLYQFYVPPGGSDVKNIEIQKGQGVKEIAKILEEQKLIRSNFWFEVYVWLAEKQNKLQAGKYSVSRSLNTVQIVELIFEGKVFADDIWVTIPEGFTLKQIKARMAENGLIAAVNLDKNKISDFEVKYKFLADAPENAGLEGFLFPDTYKFEKEAGQDDILAKLLDNFGKKFTFEMQSDILKQDRSVFEIITMASILEKELRTSQDRRIASGIFWKRIRDNYPLQSDATLSYIFDDKKDRHSEEETKIDSPYNTYKYKGLPPGPINNPGLDAIEAAIYPESSPYYFFLTKPETGEAVFAITLEEHNQNKIKYLK